MRRRRLEKVGGWHKVSTFRPKVVQQPVNLDLVCEVRAEHHSATPSRITKVTTGIICQDVDVSAQGAL